MFTPSSKKIFVLHDHEDYWPTDIKNTINWFPFDNIIENIAIHMNMDVEYILSLLKLFAMFQIKFNNNSDEKNI